MGELGFLADMGIALAAALVGGIIARRLRLPIIVGYLMAGVAIGPHGLHVVRDAEDIETLATIGVVLLLFTLGIEFSLRGLRQVGRVAILGGGLQIVATVGLGILVGWLFKWPLMQSVLFGYLIAQSSTIVILKTLMGRGELGTTHARVMLSMSLVQDLSTVPIMVLLPSLAEGTSFNWEWGWVVLRAVAFLAAIAVLGFWLVPWFMRKVAVGRSYDREIFLLTVVCLCFGAGFGAYYVGISIAVGAFLAGLLVRESEYGFQAAADIRPLRDIFATLFFVSLGMLANLSFVSENAREVGIVIVVLALGKFAISAFAPWLFGYSIKTSLLTGSGLFQVGEFSFIVAALAVGMGVLSDEVYSMTLIASVVTMMLCPFAVNLNSSAYHWLIQRKQLARLFTARLDPGAPRERKPLSNHVVICGYGRVARNLVRVLERRNLTCLLIDIDPGRLDPLRERGVPCIYGDAASPEILAQAQLDRARVMVITFPDPIAARLAVENARRINPRLDIVARVHSGEDVELLREKGVAEVVRPELEAGLEIIRHTLHRFGLTTQEIQYVVNALREEEVKTTSE
jgi:CPA2 family monovalent cation:H+ antiporter-2